MGAGYVRLMQISGSRDIGARASYPNYDSNFKALLSILTQFRQTKEVHRTRWKRGGHRLSTLTLHWALFKSPRKALSTSHLQLRLGPVRERPRDRLLARRGSGRVGRLFHS